MSNLDLEQLREKVDAVNLQILSLINERASVIQEIGKLKEKQGVNRYDPLRERHMLNLLKENNAGPLDQKTVDHIFKEIFKSALDMQEEDIRKALLVSRKKKAEDTIININGELVGSGDPSFIFGP
ncbi:chorismate mutase, partial [Planococcus faecalis]